MFIYTYPSGPLVSDVASSMYCKVLSRERGRMVCQGSTFAGDLFCIHMERLRDVAEIHLSGAGQCCGYFVGDAPICVESLYCARGTEVMSRSNTTPVCINLSYLRVLYYLMICCSRMITLH